MIRLKISSDEMKAVARFLQVGIEIARHEISTGADLVVQRFSESGNMLKQLPWSTTDRNMALVKIAERKAHIDEFERLQRKCLLGYDKRSPEKQKNIQITISSAVFMILYMSKVEHAAGMVASGQNEGMKYVNLVVSTQAGIILKQLV